MQTYDLVGNGRPLQVMSGDGLVTCKFTVPLVASVTLTVGNNSYAPETAEGIVACLSRIAGQLEGFEGRLNMRREINPGLSARWYSASGGGTALQMHTGETWYLNLSGAKASGVLVTLRFA